ncbi:MAG: hypothetical protein ACJAU2_001323, partial [Maribacter sp.]
LEIYQDSLILKGYGNQQQMVLNIFSDN